MQAAREVLARHLELESRQRVRLVTSKELEAGIGRKTSRVQGKASGARFAAGHRGTRPLLVLESVCLDSISC